ncbi:MAG: hypothetical protein M0D55_19900 [Elusimicrobiota bacterium]|nr:MAG: hypothetical protein M0D55_19900 [Elusimicrobiota bacterium]
MDPLGLVAGSGRFPLLVAEEARRRGVPVVALGIPGSPMRGLRPSLLL